MYIKCKEVILFLVFFVIFPNFSHGAFKRCFVCRSRGDLGTCKDKFSVNGTVEITVKGVTAVPCASGWCGKILETENTALKEEGGHDLGYKGCFYQQPPEEGCNLVGNLNGKKYGIATQRLCLQRGPSDSEDRCAYTKWNYRNVLMCFCKGDLCNTSSRNNINNYLLLFIVSVVITRLNSM